MSEYILHTENLSVGYQGKPIITEFSLKILPGELIGLKGLNGSGKTTLLRTLAGFIAPLRGRVLIKNNDVHLLSVEERARYLAIVLTERIRLTGMTVSELVELGRYPVSGNVHFKSQNSDQIVSNCLDMLHIGNLKSKSLAEISDGELQKTMIARALAQETEIILMDEPTAYLDYVARDEFYQIMKSLVADKKISILFSSHDIDHMEKFADRIISISN